MSLIIDGYNLLNAINIVGRGRGRGCLERARSALLNMLVSTLSEDEFATTTVVFDAKEAPPGLPDVSQHHGVTVRFARGFDEADDLIEQLIRADNVPRSLTVVSSDHRIQRAARRRRATAIDSDRWFRQLVAHKRAHESESPPVDDKPDGQLSPDEVQRWLKEFE